MKHTYRNSLFALALVAAAATGLARQRGTKAPGSGPAQAPDPEECEEPELVVCDLGQSTHVVCDPDVPSARDESRRAWTTAVEPKPLGEAARRGLAWIASRQHEDGGWSQGEESAHMRGGQEPVDRSNVADTCMAALALVRSGSSPSDGDYAAALERAVGFVCGQVEAHADDPSLWITDVRGTRVQGKIGTYIDTFAASMLLGEVQGRMPDDEGNARARAALAVVLDKIERNQASNGTWDNQGWAPVLAQSVAAKGLNRLRQLGYSVDAKTLERADDFALEGGAAPGSAGVVLYDSASGLGALQDAVNTSVRREGELKAELARATGDADEVTRLQRELDDIGDLREAGRRAKQDVIAKLGDESFVAGFGSNGGEEFLSYMNISESLVVDADPTWRRWDAWVTNNLSRVQNQDGSWTGHHCITGRTFCTATALLTLLADRTPVPVELLEEQEPSAVVEPLCGTE